MIVLLCYMVQLVMKQEDYFEWVYCNNLSF